MGQEVLSNAWPGYWSLRVGANRRIVVRFEKGVDPDVVLGDHGGKLKRRYEADMGPLRNSEHPSALMANGG